MIMLDSPSSSGGSPGSPSSADSYQPAKTKQAQDASAQAGPPDDIPTIQQGEDVNVEDIPF
jgi:hypothetical protein